MESQLYHYDFNLLVKSINLLLLHFILKEKFSVLVEMLLDALTCRNYNSAHSYMLQCSVAAIQILNVKTS